MKRKRPHTWLMIACCAGMLCGGGLSEPYGNILPEQYLTGRFDPAKSPLFIEMSSIGVPTDGRKQYLRREAAGSLVRMIRDFKKEHPKIHIFVRSSTRTWNDQKWIWETKWNGRTLVEGKKLNETVKKPLERALTILEYSSMPGTSRHHWGTDFDINSLVNSFYESGEGKVIFDWLTENAGRYGFCRPYTPGRRTGYREEKWHWSYIPLARIFTRHWMKLYGKFPRRMVKDESFDGAERAVGVAARYVWSVDDQCR